jgi:hypothetical protein
MTASAKDDVIEAAAVTEGDVIEDPAGGRWLTVQEIQVISAKGDGIFSFYGAGPDDRITVTGAEKMRRRKRRD